MTEIMSCALPTETSNEVSPAVFAGVEANLEDGSLTYLPTVNISVLDGFNPREFFDETLDKELLESIKSKGIIQPVVVFPSENGQGFYHIVAGERRFRAACKLGLDEIPVLIKNISVEEAYLLAVIENTIRANMSVGDEVKAATNVLSAADGDREEACKRLGWNRYKLDARLLLSHANKTVLDAVALNTIKIGVAELLSQLPTEMQDKTLAAVIENKYTIIQIKEKLAGFVLDLSKAIFDVSACNGCPHNSSLQASIFDEHIELGRCANPTCFGGKTQSFMEAKKADLVEKYNKVFLDTEKTKDSYSIIQLNGTSGVGAEQFETGCKSCAHFGAILDTSPSKLGSIVEDVCFSTSCLKKKIAAYQEKGVSAPVVNDSTSTPVGTEIPAHTSKAAGTTAKPKAESKPAKEKPKEVPKKVIKTVDDFISVTAQTITEQSDHIGLVTCTLMAYLATKNKIELLPEKMAEAIKADHAEHDQAKLIVWFYRCSVETLNSIQIKIAAHLLSIPNVENSNQEQWVKSAKSILQVTKTDISQHFIVSKEFLGAFTKSGMEATLNEVQNPTGESFITYYEEKTGKDSFKKLMSQKNAEIIAAVIESGFDFTGFVPSVVTQQLNPAK
jgi:PRTRC genetic system ParB family protein